MVKIDQIEIGESSNVLTGSFLQEGPFEEESFGNGYTYCVFSGSIQ
jgi:hypothetical protein